MKFKKIECNICHKLLQEGGWFSRNQKDTIVTLNAKVKRFQSSFPNEKMTYHFCTDCFIKHKRAMKALAERAERAYYYDGGE